MTGWRVGWMASSQTEIVRASLVLHGFLTVCTSTISQKASLLGWTEEAEKAKPMLVKFTDNAANFW